MIFSPLKTLNNGVRISQGVNKGKGYIFNAVLAA
jgi:hypothetical protein